MDDFSQIIGIILAIIFFIASAIRKKNKKNGAPVKENKLSDVLESFLGGEIQHEQEPEPDFVTPYEAEVPKYEPVVRENPKSTIHSNEEQSSISSSIGGTLHSLTKKNPMAKPKEKKKHNIDLRQAVIYSEILNRKEY